MSENNNLFNQLWEKSSTALEQIFQLRSMTQEIYLSLFHSVNNYYQSREYDDNLLRDLLNQPKPINESNKNDEKKDDETNDNQVDINIPGGELYFKIKKFFKEYLENIAANGDNLQGEDFLRFYAKTWENYQFSSRIANGIFTTVNSNWVHRQKVNNVKGIYDIYTMAMKIWQDIFFKEPTQSLTQTCLNLIHDERTGKYVDSMLIRQVVQSYVRAGFTKSERDNRSYQSISSSLTMYVNYFEKQFLQETEQFYLLESLNFIASNSPNAYIKKITERLNEEEYRVKNFLHPTTLEKLKPLLEKILIESQLEPIYAESKKLLRDEKLEDLRILFELVNRVNTANEPIQQDLEDYIYAIGMDAIDRKSATAIKDPKIYVEIIIEIYQKFSRIITEGYAGQHSYVVALDKAFSKFINDNAVTREAKKEAKKSAKSPELLAKYCDKLLQKGNRAEESDVEEKINQIMVVFNYIEDKDVFQKYYGTLLAKRLVGQLSASDDYEELIISKLKAACGFEYASKLQRMFQDMRLSASLNEEYKTYCENKQLTNNVNFSAMVLSSNSWTFTASAPFNLPTELKRMIDSFNNFYSAKFNNRKLDLRCQQSKGELQTLYTRPKYTLQVSTYQMTILLLFNEFDNMTVERIIDKTQIDSELFGQVLWSLLQSKILICSEINADELKKDFKENIIKMDYNIQVSTSFESKKIKINLSQPIKSVEQKDSDMVDQQVEEDRKILIQAAIVRVMKTRKTLKQNLLTEETIKQLNSRFKPQIPMIKKCIEILIEKEYLQRDPNEKDRFSYVAASD